MPAEGLVDGKLGPGDQGQVEEQRNKPGLGCLQSWTGVRHVKNWAVEKRVDDTPESDTRQRPNCVIKQERLRNPVAVAGDSGGPGGQKRG